MKKYVIVLILCVFTLLANAVPAARVTFTHTQKDGTVLTLRLVGDEHMHYYVNTANGQAMRRAADGDYMVMAETELAAQTEQAAVRRANMNQQRVARLPLMQQRAKEGMRKIGTIDKNLSGNKSVLVLLVAFSDKAFSGTQSDFDNQFNQQNYSANGHIGSVHDYFYDQSYGALNLSFDVYGPVTLSNAMEYYGANDANKNDVRPREMVKEAVQKANTSYDIDFTKYDWDNDGKVDQVVVIYAGYAESQGAPDNTIWPHQWELSGIGTLSGATYDRKTINSYACLSELKGKTGSTRDGIGTFCHEFSHCLGLPDFYDTDYSDNGTANDMSYFDVMAGGSYNGPNNAVPCGYTAYERWQFGWVTPTELSEAATITGMKPLNDANPDTYIIYNQKNPNEYFLLENRQSNRWFKYSSSYTAGHGLFITHCNYVSSYWTNNTINATAGNEHFVYVPANGTYGTSSTNMQKAFFPVGATSFTDDSHSSCGGALWTSNTDGTKKLGVPITDITESNGLISFDVLGGMHDDGTRYTITLDACGGTVTPTAWTQTSYKQSWTLPKPTTTVVGWEGAGWSLTPVNTNTSLDDVDLIDYNQPYTPESNVTLYAVYMNDDFICNSYPEGGDITITPISGIPAGYYNSTIVGKNDRELELALKAIVNPHTKIAYNSLWRAFETTDVVPTALLKDPAKTDQVYDMYANINTFTKYYSDNDHSQTGGINREHCVPNSWWGGESGNATAYTDLHHLVPSDGAANNAKSNHPLGEYKSGMTLSWPTETKTNTGGYTYVVADNTLDHSGSWSHVWNTTSSTKVFEPANEFKGDFARMYLYVVCAYEGDLTWQTADNTMFSNDANNYTTIADDAKALLLKWHRQDPVSDKERLRNNAVQSIQGNRNPFIDYPVLVEYVWGDSIAKTTFSLERMPSSYQFGVTYNAGTNVTCDESLCLCDRGSSVTLPTATTTIGGWTFSGWTTSRIENTTTAPSPLLTGNYTPTENVELYAVFQAGDTYSIAPEVLEIPGGESGVAALYFPHIAHVGQPFTAPAFTTNSNGAQTWTSSNTSVATVDNEGRVTIHAVGTTIITVTQAETATYRQGTASYMIKVVE